MNARPRLLPELHCPDMGAAIRRTRVMVLPISTWLPMLRGEVRIKNLPPDACIVAVSPRGTDMGIRVQSDSYSPVPEGMQLPLVIAVIERKTV